MNRHSRLKARTHQNHSTVSSSSSSSSSSAPVTSSSASSPLWRPGFSATGLRRRRSVVTSVYLFAHPLSESLRTLDLVNASRSVRDWRTLPGVKPCDDIEEMVVDRLLELERLQVPFQLRFARSSCPQTQQARGSKQLQPQPQPFYD